MPRTKAPASLKTFVLPELIVSHLRWVVVLAQLKEAELNDKIGDLERQVSSRKASKKAQKQLEALQNKRKRSVRELVRELNLEVLFADSTEVRVSLTETDWEDWFASKAPKENKNPFNTIYQCRNFYALDAPNNLVQRLSNIFKQAESESFNISTDREGKYDRYILRWGEYALKLVRENNGWENFSQVKSLSEIQDLWDGKYPPEVEELAKNADHYNSLVQRILHLERDRYIQILTSTVSMLWPLWFLRSHQRIIKLKEVINFLQLNENIFIGKPLPENDLFIDINTFIGKMEGLPYPFGIADEFIFLGASDGSPMVKEQRFSGNPWPASSQDHISRHLQNEFWNPPLLFAVRSDIFNPAISADRNETTPFIQISEKCDSFFNLYLSEPAYTNLTSDKSDKDECFKNLVFMVEPGTYGDKVVKKLRQDGKLYNSARTCDRLKLSGNFKDINDVDVFALFPPVDILIQASEKFKKVTASNLYEVFSKNARYFPMHFPGGFLCAGVFLKDQPKFVDLLIDTCNYLGKVDFIFRYLMPDRLRLNQEFINLHLDELRYKKNAANEISKICNVFVERKELITRGILPSNAMEQWMKEIGEEMSKVLYRNIENGMEQEFMTAWNDWGWAIQLEFQKYTSINISHNLL